MNDAYYTNGSNVDDPKATAPTPVWWREAISNLATGMLLLSFVRVLHEFLAPPVGVASLRYLDQGIALVAFRW